MQILSLIDDPSMTPHQSMLQMHVAPKRVDAIHAGRRGKKIRGRLERAILLAILLPLVGCGSAGPWRPKVEGPYLQGKHQYWLVRPHGKPRAMIVFLHGLSRYTGEQLVQWQKHL